jgi:hypothetical protein
MALGSNLIAGLLAASALAASASAQTSAPATPAPAAQAAPQAAPVDPFAAIPPARPEDVASIDVIMKALYNVISGDAGKKRDWNRFRSLFYPGARMAPTGTNPKTGKILTRYLTPDDYVNSSGPYLEKEGFHEQELVRHVDAYGNIAQIFSSYEARRKLGDEKPFLRGINSVQLFNDGTRWWVTSITWSAEDAKHPLPAAFDKKKPS